MTACRDIINEALRALGIMDFAGQSSADEIDGGLSALEDIVSDLHGSRGAMFDVDVANDYLASENQRIRVQAGSTVVVSLPNSILLEGNCGIDDYHFGQAQRTNPLRGSNSPADGRLSRLPSDGARIEIVGTTHGLYFYRADINAWVSASPLTVDGPTPLNARFDSALASLVAERLCGPMNLDPSPLLARRIVRANSALLVQPAMSRVRQGSLHL